ERAGDAMVEPADRPFATADLQAGPNAGRPTGPPWVSRSTGTSLFDRGDDTRSDGRARDVSHAKRLALEPVAAVPQRARGPAWGPSGLRGSCESIPAATYDAPSRKMAFAADACPRPPVYLTPVSKNSSTVTAC